MGGNVVEPVEDTNCTITEDGRDDSELGMGCVGRGLGGDGLLDGNVGVGGCGGGVYI